MQRLILTSKYPESFAKKFLPKIIKGLMISELHKYKDAEIIKHICKSYKCSLSDIADCLRDIKVDKYKTIYIIHYDTLDKLNSNIKKSTILHNLNYGTLQVKGLQIIDNIIISIGNNLNYFYRLYNIHTAQRLKRKG